MCIGISNDKYNIFTFFSAKFDIGIGIYIGDGLNNSANKEYKVETLRWAFHCIPYTCKSKSKKNQQPFGDCSEKKKKKKSQEICVKHYKGCLTVSLLLLMNMESRCTITY